MPVSYSKDLRGRVIAAWLEKEGSQRQLAQRFKVSLSFVRNLVRHYRESGQIQKTTWGYQKPIIQDEHLSMIKSLVEGKNDLLLRELCSRRSPPQASLCRTHRD